MDYHNNIFINVKSSFPIFLQTTNRKKVFKIIKYNSLEEAKEVYGKDNLIPISFIKQIIFYTKHGCQPKFTYESEKENGKIVCWFLKSETAYLNKKWNETKIK